MSYVSEEEEAGVGQGKGFLGSMVKFDFLSWVVMALFFFIIFFWLFIGFMWLTLFIFK